MIKKISFLMIAILFISFASAEIIINQQPKDLYNLDDVINIPIKIVTSLDVASLFSLEFFCNGEMIEVPHKEYVVLSSGQEKQLNPSIPLIKDLLGNITGICKIKAVLDEEYILTEEFKISNLITIELRERKTEFVPEENIIIEGEAKKENGELVENGFVKLEIMNENLTKEIESLDSVRGGYFFINVSLPKDASAGQHPVKLFIYDKDKDENVRNKGELYYNILLGQVPTSLEIAYEEREIEPGTIFKVKAVLHDQTGGKIDSNAIITIKNKNGKILEEIEMQTDEFLEFPVEYNELPSEWTVNASSNGLTNEEIFKIKEKKDVKIELINKTIILTNIGNVPYHDILLVKIDNQSLNINASLEIDESQTYILSAPDGEYLVEVIKNGRSQITGNVMLTGDTIDIRKASSSIITLVRYPIAWIFIVTIFGFVGFIIFKKGYRRSFFEYIRPGRKKEKDSKSSSKETLEIVRRNKAELSLSIKGDKQSVSIVCLKIKNAKDIGLQKGNAKETIQKLVDIAERNKAYTYENQENIFFILSAIKTKTFKNERLAIEIAGKVKAILEHHNKLFKQKIDFGISINYGEIIAKQESLGLKFMSMGTLTTLAKKISALADKKILLSKNLNERLTRDIKTEKHTEGDTAVYTIKEIKNMEEGKIFANNLIKKLGKEKGKN